MTSQIVDEYLGLMEIRGDNKMDLEKGINVGGYIKKNIDYFLQQMHEMLLREEKQKMRQQ